MIQLTLQGFRKNYYYKTELVELCRTFELPTYGTKSELISYIEAYLGGKEVEKIQPIRSRRNKTKLTMSEIGLDTPLFNSGFGFNDEARSFFEHYFGVKHFSFTKQMAQVKRMAEERKDYSKTVRDLIYVDTDYIKNVPEEQSYQWNNFVKDFCESAESNRYSNKLKVASILWDYAKNNTEDKKYTDQVLERNLDKIQAYKS